MAEQIGQRLPACCPAPRAPAPAPVRAMTAAELAETVRVAYDPARPAAGPGAGPRRRGQDPGVTWADAGPAAQVEDWDALRHDSGASITWQMIDAAAGRGAVAGPRAAARAAPAAWSASASRCSTGRTTRPARPRIADADVRTALGRATAAQGRGPGRRDPGAAAARQTAAEQAAGAGLTRFALLVTATVDRPRAACPRRPSLSTSSAGACRLRLRRCYATPVRRVRRRPRRRGRAAQARHRPRRPPHRPLPRPSVACLDRPPSQGHRHLRAGPPLPGTPRRRPSALVPGTGTAAQAPGRGRQRPRRRLPGSLHRPRLPRGVRRPGKRPGLLRRGAAGVAGHDRAGVRAVPVGRRRRHPDARGPGRPAPADRDDGLLRPDQLVRARPLSCPTRPTSASACPALGKSTFTRRQVLGLAGQGVRPLVLGDLKPDYADLIARARRAGRQARPRPGRPERPGRRGARARPRRRSARPARRRPTGCAPRPTAGGSPSCPA